MRILPIAYLGEDILNKAAAPVANDEFSKCGIIVEQMLATLDALGERIGLAAPQVFIDKRIVIFRIPKSTHNRYQLEETAEEVPFTVMLNPSWQPIKDTKADGWEACISLPNLMGIVSRYTDVAYEYFDQTGKLHKRTASGFHSRVIQHECDHLDGYVFTKRMTDLSSLTFEDVKLKNSQHFNEKVA
jgi:peptide deformylase